MRKSAIWVAFLICGACKLPTIDSSTSSTAIVAEGMPPSSASSVTDSEALRLTMGLGFFVHEKIESCADSDLTFKRQADLDKFKQSLLNVAREDPDAAKKGGGVTAFPNGCAASFKDRVALATCTKQSTPGAKATGVSTDTYYAIEYLQDESKMRDCMKQGGKWSSLPHDSDEYQLADSEWKLRKSEAELKRLQGH